MERALWETEEQSPQTDLAQPLRSYVILDESLAFSKPQFSYLQNGDNAGTYCMRLLKGINTCKVFYIILKFSKW